MVNGSFPQIELSRDHGGVVRQVLSEDWLFPEEINSETPFNWLGKPQESLEEYFGIKRQVEFSNTGNPVIEKTDFFGAYSEINNYDPLTGAHIGSFLEIDDE